jgi:hypothetical protein
MSDPINIPKYRLKQGGARPYDAKAGESVDQAHVAARGVMADLADRGGIKDMIARISDPEVRQEIVSDIAAIIREAMQPGSEPPLVATAKALRDEFAMAALTGWARRITPATQDGSEWLARECYEMADAMMKARGQ